MKIYTYRSGHKALKRFLSITLSLLVLVQMTPAAFVVNSAQAIGTSPYGNDPVKKITLCHDESGDGLTYHSSGGISVSAALSGHDGHSTDIIPPFYSQSNPNDPIVFYPGKNWTAVNEDIWANGDCNGDGIIVTEIPGCMDADANNFNPDATQDDGSCTYDPTTGTITITKIVDNTAGGTKVVSDFPLFLNGMSITSGVATTTAAGTYTITETSNSSYTGSFDSGCPNGQITVTAGGSAGCTLTNTYTVTPSVTGSIIVQKIVINDNGGTAATSSFSFTVDGGLAIAFEADGENVVSGLSLGSHTIAEVPAPGYNMSFSSNCSSTGLVNIPADGTPTCIIVNDDIAPNTPVVNVGVDKFVNDASPDEGQQIVFTLVVSNSGPDTATNVVANDSIGSDFTFVSASSTVGTYASSTGNWTIGSLTNSASATLEITVTVNSATAGQSITNIATVIASETDSDSSNNTDSASVLVNTPQTPTDVCVNIDGNQETVPEGMIRDENGNCNRPENPTDVCANIEGNQSEIPQGMEIQNGDQCVTPTTTTTSGGGSSHHSGGGGIVLGINNDAPQGQVLGATFEPGLPNTGNGPLNSSETNTLAILFAGLVALVGLNLASFKALKLEVKSK